MKTLIILISLMATIAFSDTQELTPIGGAGDTREIHGVLSLTGTNPEINFIDVSGNAYVFRNVNGVIQIRNTSDNRTDLNIDGDGVHTLGGKLLLSNSIEVLKKDNSNSFISIASEDDDYSQLIFKSDTDPNGANINWRYKDSLMIIATRQDGAAMSIRTGDNDAAIDIDNSQNVIIHGTVQVGETAIPSGFTFAVAGKTMLTYLKVQPANEWPDFALKAGYKLKELSQVESFIKSNGHLEGVPSAAVVAKDGIDVYEMNRVLMLKVEELTLHAISQDKRLKALER